MDDLKNCSNIITVSLDLSNWSDTRKTLSKVFNNVEIDGLINNAGITICKKFEDFTEEDYDKYVQFNIQYMIIYLLCAPSNIRLYKKISHPLLA